MRNLFNHTWVDAREHIRQSEGVVVCFGSVEEHGYHLPMGTDTVLAHEFAKALCQLEDLYYYPCTTFGQVWSAREYEGTVSVSPECLQAYGMQVVESVLRAEPKRVFLFSFHNGNHKVLDEMLRQLQDKDPGCRIYHIRTTGMEKKASRILTTPMWNGRVWHGGELETSLMLHVAPELVRMDRATVEFPPVPPLMDLRPVPWKEFSQSGAFGDATAATEEKGAALFALILEHLRQQIRSVKEYEQQTDSVGCI